jgi:phage tail-like protein
MTTVRRFFQSPRFLAGAIAVLAIAAGDRLMSLAIQQDLPRYSFVVDVEGTVLSAFREVAGLDVEFEVVEYRDGSGGPTRYIPGARKYSNIVLKRGFTGDSELYDWFTEFNRAEPVSGSISMYDQTNHEVARWNFQNAWPTKYHGPRLNTDNNDIPIESIELVHEGLSRVAPARR